MPDLSSAPLADETFGQRIKRKRGERRLTQRQVAEKLELDFTYLSKLENDRGEPAGEKTVRNLAAVLNDDVEELLALAAKIPEQLRDRAQHDVVFARLLRRLPDLPDEIIRGILDEMQSGEPARQDGEAS